MTAAVAHVTARFAGAGGRRAVTSFVCKHLEGDQRREAAVYEAVLVPHAPCAAPRFLGAEAIGPAASYLYLEYVCPSRTWPWAQVALAGLVLEQLAHLHATLPRAAFDAAPARWDYEAELVGSAQTTLAQYDRVVAHEDLAALRPVGPALRRMVAALPVVRRQLLAAGPFGPAVLHGDVHAGNAVVHAVVGAERLVLLDWARARVGPPLEDVSSWLQSLGFWEPVARQRHDTLLRRYLAARGASTHLGRDLRDAYWLAAAGNALAGALRYYLTVADGWGGAPARARADAARAARDHLRVIRRADAVWRR
jgi:aminoglycoside phosphotransferase (APT) family kinase protein